MNGVRVLVMRPVGASDELCMLLREHGAEVIQIPGVAIEQGDAHAIDQALARGGVWAVFASVSAVPPVLSRGGLLSFERIAAVGEATARALREGGARCDFVPDTHTTEALARALPGSGCVSVFRSSAGNDELERCLQERGFEVNRVDAYNSYPVNETEVSAALSTIDAALLTSASIATTFARALDDSPVEQPIVVSIGPVTTRAATELGIRVDVEAQSAGPKGIVDALERAIASRVS